MFKKILGVGLAVVGCPSLAEATTVVTRTIKADAYDFSLVRGNDGSWTQVLLDLRLSFENDTDQTGLQYYTGSLRAATSVQLSTLSNFYYSYTSSADRLVISNVVENPRCQVGQGEWCIIVTNLNPSYTNAEKAAIFLSGNYSMVSTALADGSIREDFYTEERPNITRVVQVAPIAPAGPNVSREINQLSPSYRSLFDSRVTAVPEAATWAMMLVGFGMVGGAARYRRRTVKVSLA